MFEIAATCIVHYDSVVSVVFIGDTTPGKDAWKAIQSAHAANTPSRLHERCTFKIRERRLS